MNDDWSLESAIVSRETRAKLELLARSVVAENARQNLISRSSEGEIWTRHVLDSAQLLTILPTPPQPGDQWFDVGSGAGFPGLVVAIIATCQVTLVENRRLRCAFLGAMIERLEIANCSVTHARVETIAGQADYISARAYAPLERLIRSTRHLTHTETIWLLPKGENGVKELASLPASWQDAFHVEQSVTDPRSAILVGRGKFAGAAR